MRSEHQRWIGGAAVIVLLALIAHNLLWLKVNQRTIACNYSECKQARRTAAKAPPILSWLTPESWGRPCGYSVCEQPRDIERAAALNAHPVVRGRERIYHYLAQRIPHAALTIPSWMAEHKWYLERVARLRIEISGSTLLVAPEHVKQLRRSASGHRQWLREGHKRTRTRTWQTLYFLLDDATREYVLAETEKAGGPLFVLPKSRFRAVTSTEGSSP